MVGCSEIDVTPKHPVWLMGYAARTQKSNGVTEPISIGAIAISKDNTTLLFISCDLSGISYQKQDQIKRRLHDSLGISRDNITISCSHTHFAPGLSERLSINPEDGFIEPDPDFHTDFMEKLEIAASRSLENLESASLHLLKIDTPQVLFNRRTVKKDGTVETNYTYPDHAEELVFQPYDGELSVLKFSTTNGPKAMLVNFGCHPVTGGFDQEDDFYKISADYPFYLRHYLKEEYKCHVSFTLGAAGDTVPIRRYGQSRQKIGRILADSICLNEKKFHPIQIDELKVVKIGFEAETLVNVDASCLAEFDKQRAKARENNINRNVTDSRGSANLALTDSYYIAGEKVAQLKRYPDNRWSTDISIVQMGDVRIINSPFETSSEISLKLKEANPNTILFTCTNGYEGYLFPAYEFERGGYEIAPHSSNFKPDTADRLVELLKRNPQA